MKDKEFEIKSVKHSYTNQISNDSKFFKNTIVKDDEDLEEFQPIIEPYIKDMLKKDLEDFTNFVTFTEDSEISTIKIMELYNQQSGINNTYADNKCIYFLGTFFPVKTEFYKYKVVSNNIIYDIIDTNGVKSLKRR